MNSRQRDLMLRLLGKGVLDPVVVADVERGEVATKHVYLMHSGGLFKIGFATDPHRRLAAINCGSAQAVELLWTMETSQWAHVESELHKRFAARRTKGEWFALTSADILAIKLSNRLPTIRSIS